MRRVVLLLPLWTLFVAASTDGVDKRTTPAPIDCGSLRSTDIRWPMLVETEIKEGKLVTTVSCEGDYLLVPQNGSVVQCDYKTGDWIFPECQAIPSVGFSQTTLVHNMAIPELILSLQLTHDTVREFDVSVNVDSDGDSQNTEATAEEYDDFEITTKTVHFQEGDGKKVKYVALKITDSHKSGINKHFRLCLTIGTTDWNETRAILTAHSKCIDITIMNTNLAGLVLLQPSYIFTRSSQSLTFFVGYRTCDIHVDITISRMAWQQYTTSAFISQDCSACVVDLVDQGMAFNFTKEMVGNYNAELVAGDDCKVNKSKINFQIQVTLTPDEVLEKGTEVGLGESKVVEVNSSDHKWPSQLHIPIWCTSLPQYLFQLKLSVIQGEVVVGTVEVDVPPSDCPHHIDISQNDQIIDHINNSCFLREMYGVHLEVLTVPSVALVLPGHRHGLLLVSHVIDVQFGHTAYITYDDSVLSVKIKSSTCIDLRQYITVCFLSNDQTSCRKDLTYERSKDPNIWDVGNLTDIKLQSLTLSIQLRDEEDQEAFPHLPQTATFTSGAVLNFVKGQYQYEGTIKIESSRQMDGVKLNMLVTLNCEELDITYNVPPTNDNTSQWEITVTLKNTSEQPPTDVIITMEVVEEMEGIIILGSTKSITVSKGTFTSELSEPVETSFSFETLIVLFGVFIAPMVVVVILYIGVSRRKQMHMEAAKKLTFSLKTNLLPGRQHNIPYIKLASGSEPT